MPIAASGDIYFGCSNFRQYSVFAAQPWWQDQQNVYILLELCPSQTLNDLLRKRRRFTEAEALYYM